GDDDRGPPLRAHFVARLFEHPAIEPSHHGGTADTGTRPQRVIRVFRKREMVCRKTRADQRELASGGVIHREVPPRFIDRNDLRRPMIGSLAAEPSARVWAYARRAPAAS